MPKLTIIPVGMLQTNCMIVWDEGTRAGLLVDPGDEAPTILARIEQLGVKIQAILLTHSHADHIGALPELYTRLGAPLWLAKEEQPLYFSSQNELLPWLPHVTNLPIPAQEMPPHDGFDFQVIHTPGHTPGGVCYYFPKDKLLLSGDTLFAGGVGRTDLGGDAEALHHSVFDLLFALPDDTAVFPGHGPSTTIGAEKANPPEIW